MNRRDRRRRQQWYGSGGPAEVFIFGCFWGLIIGMTLMGCLLQLGGR